MLVSVPVDGSFDSPGPGSWVCESVPETVTSPEGGRANTGAELMLPVEDTQPRLTSTIEPSLSCSGVTSHAPGSPVRVGLAGDDHLAG